MAEALAKNLDSKFECYLARVTSIEFIFFLFILTQESIKITRSKCVVKENIVLQEVEELSFSTVLIILSCLK